MIQKTISIRTNRRGLHMITDEITQSLSNLPKAGLLNCFIHHTSASLIIQENADPSAREDLETFLNKLIPDGESWHIHTHEGEDDTTSHMKSAITNVSLNIPIINAKLGLGTWQGIYLWEHRHGGSQRNITLTVLNSGT